MTQSASTAASSIENELKGARSRATKLRVFHIPDDILTLTTIAPDEIETYSEVEVHDSADKAVVDGTLDALIAAGPHHTSESAEMRWKLVFFDPSEARILEVYAAPKYRGPVGMIQSTPVECRNDTFMTWLYKHFA